MSSLPRRIFITGTDTDVGKTHVVHLLAIHLQQAGYRVGIYKPACSGVIDPGSPEPRWRDIESAHQALGGAFDRGLICPQTFRYPLAPNQAARLEGRSVDEDLLLSGAEAWNGLVDVLLVEGAGGWLSPISDSWTNADLAARMQADVLLVAANRLGVINHALLTIAQIRLTNRLLGAILNNIGPETGSSLFPEGLDRTELNRQEIETRGHTPVWGTVPFADGTVSAETLGSVIREGKRVPADWGEWLDLPPVRTDS